MRRLVLFLLTPSVLFADPLNCAVRAGSDRAPGAHVAGETLIVSWTGEHGAPLSASFEIDHGTPLVRELKVWVCSTLVLKNPRELRV